MPKNFHAKSKAKKSAVFPVRLFEITDFYIERTE